MAAASPPPVESPSDSLPHSRSWWQLKLLPYAEALAPYVAEFLGTFFIVFTVGCNTISGDRTWMPTSISFCVMVAMYGSVAISGGHLNPALSFAFGLAWKLKWGRILGYWLAQFTAALLAAWLCVALLDTPVRVGPKNEFDWFDSMIVEVVYSTMYCFVGLNCMASFRNNPKEDRNQFFALAVGFVSVAGGHTTRQISGAFFNPAMTLGFGLTSGSLQERSWTLVYAGYQFAGSVVATVLFFMVRPEELSALGLGGKGLSCRRACAALSLCGAPRNGQDDLEARPPTVQQTTPTPAPSGPEGNYRSPFAARVLSEFIGTYAIVFTFGLSTSMLTVERNTVMMHANRTAHARSHVQNNATSMVFAAARSEEAVMARYLAGEVLSEEQKMIFDIEESSTVAWATGAAVLCMVYALGNVSGAHFNPAVTLANMCTANCGGPGNRQLRPFEGLFFILAQAAAAVTAALTYVCVHRGRSKVNDIKIADLGPRPGYGWNSVAIGEVVFTGAVALSVLCMMTVRDPRYPKAPNTRGFQFAWAIGMCVTASSFALEGITGGYLNPSLDLGVSAANFIYSGFKFGNRISLLVHYVIYQAIGGLVAAVIFRLMHPLEYKEDPLLQ